MTTLRRQTLDPAACGPPTAQCAFHNGRRREGQVLAPRRGRDLDADRQVVRRAPDADDHHVQTGLAERPGRRLGGGHHRPVRLGAGMLHIGRHADPGESRPCRIAQRNRHRARIGAVGSGDQAQPEPEIVDAARQRPDDRARIGGGADERKVAGQRHPTRRRFEAGCRMLPPESPAGRAQPGHRGATVAAVATLRAFTDGDAETVSTWATGADEVAAWCSRTGASVPAEIIAGWSRQPDVRSYLLVADGVPVGYGETWIDDDEREVELARIIVAPRARGRGRGRELARLLVAEAHRSYPDVFLRVVPGNAAAVACYAAAGFTRLDPATEEQWNRAQPRSYVWMAFTGLDARPRAMGRIAHRNLTAIDPDMPSIEDCVPGGGTTR
jgi:ribosomal protein S18 acetylase RimI-like enzyme